MDFKVSGSRFNKIFAKRETSFEGKTKLNVHLKILNIEVVKNIKNSIKVDYDFKIEYDSLGEINLIGFVFLNSKKENIKEVLRLWENKKLNDEKIIEITNILFKIASIKAFELEEELGLPIHVKLPSLSFG